MRSWTFSLCFESLIALSSLEDRKSVSTVSIGDTSVL